MQVSVEKTEGLGRRISLMIAADSIKKAIQSELIKTAKNARIDGFRKGKVPLKIVEQRYGAHIHQEALSDLMQRTVYDAFMANNIEPVGNPTYKPGPYTPGQDFTFDVEFEVLPEIEINDLISINVEKPIVEIKDVDVDNMIETLRKQQSTWKAFDGAARQTDRVTINFVGSIDNEEFEGGKATGFVLAMGQNQMIPGFEEGIIGHKTGDKFEVSVTFPEDYHAENLKGKPAVFVVELTKVEEQILPELNEQTIKRFGITNGTLDGLKKEVRKNMQRELTVKIRSEINKQVIDGLLEKNKIDVPSALTEQEVETLRQQAVQRYGMDKNKSGNLPKELFIDEAKRRVTVGLLFNEYITKQGLKADEEKVEALIAEIASAYEDPQEVVEYYHSNKELMNKMQAVALEDKVIDTILSVAQVTNKEYEFSSFMGSNSAV